MTCGVPAPKCASASPAEIISDPSPRRFLIAVSHDPSSGRCITNRTGAFEFTRACKLTSNSLVGKSKLRASTHQNLRGVDEFAPVAFVVWENPVRLRLRKIANVTYRGLTLLTKIAFAIRFSGVDSDGKGQIGQVTAGSAPHSCQ